AGDELNPLPLDRSSARTAPAGFDMGSTGFLTTLTDLSAGSPVYQPSSPLTLDYKLDQTEISQARSDLSRLKLAIWSGKACVAISCSTARLTWCALPQPGLVALISAAAPGGALDGP